MTGDDDDPPVHERPASHTEPDAMEQPGSEQRPPLDAEEDEPEIEPMAGPPPGGADRDTGHGYGYE